MPNKVINVQKVSKSFDELKALEAINLSVERGEILGYIGPNGAGKTTTIRILLGLLRPSQGQVSVLGVNPYFDSREGKAARRRVGFMLDVPGLFPYASAYRNLMYYAKLYGIDDPDKRVISALVQVGLWEKRRNRVEVFSHGMKQRLSLGRAILHDPEILILDEPTSGLDPTFQKMVRDFLKSFAADSKKAVLLSSHNLAEVQQICSRVGLISKGKIVALGSIKELQAQYSKKMIEVRLGNGCREERKEHLCQAIRALPDVNKCVSELDFLRIELRDLAASHTINEFIVKQGIAVAEIRSKETSLEEIYNELAVN